MKRPRVPKLVPGDRLDAAEYWRRYQATPEKFKAELIDGVVSVPPPNTADHSRAAAVLCGWTGLYEADTLGYRGLLNTTIRLDHANVPQPDQCMVPAAPRTSQVRADPDGYLDAAPAFALEVVTEDATLELGPKLRMYEWFGSREYLVHHAAEGWTRWWTRDAGGRFIDLSPDAAGVMRSRAFPGLWLNAAAALSTKDAMRGVMDTLKAGLASPDHAPVARGR